MIFQIALFFQQVQQLQFLIVQAIQTVTTSHTKSSDNNDGGFFSWLFGKFASHPRKPGSELGRPYHTAKSCSVAL